MKKQIKIAFKFLMIMTLLTGLAYPFLMTGLAQLVFHSKANGSIIENNGRIIGSGLIGQKFDSSVYFWSRPSAIGYNPIPSGASNFGPTSDTLKKLADSRRILFSKMNSVNDPMSVPKEMIFASGSGLDPDTSPEAALLQVDRVSQARNFSSLQKEKLLKQISDLTENPQFLFLGEPRINVLRLNIALDKIDNKLNNK
jgi:potassium-transporting ATPase KdpC subunit